MTPGARIAALQELLSLWEAQESPLDFMLRVYFRERRYIGSHDRRYLSETLFSLLRMVMLLDAWIERLNLKGYEVHRWRVILYLVYQERQGLAALRALFSGMAYHPAILAPHEEEAIEAFINEHKDWPSLPRWINLNCPQWLYELLASDYGEAGEDEIKALNVPASLDLRVNTLKVGREKVKKDFQSQGLMADLTSFSPLALRLPRGTAVMQTDPYKRGWIEVQDEGSQLAALLVDARRSQNVLDYCAGGGGKALALAAAMENKGELVATDISLSRLQEAEKRFIRAGVTNGRCHLLPLQDELHGTFERVLIDAPCSGIGTWRRNPDMRFRLTQERLAELLQKQKAILNEASLFVAPRGRLIYATCSLLKKENEAQIEEFLATHPDFLVIPYGFVWEDVMKSPPPTDEDFLVLTPARHQTDGFFVAILERRPS